jgi:sec-independent protein translocase protein TatB
MPGFGDYIFLFLLALVLFGPKKMPELARQLGKLMAEFRKASNEFKMQMEEELRTSERAEHDKKIAALAAPPASAETTPGAMTETPAIATSGELTMRPPETGVPVGRSEAAQSEEAAPVEGAARSAEAVNALADSVPAAGEHTHGEQTTHG